METIMVTADWAASVAILLSAWQRAGTVSSATIASSHHVATVQTDAGSTLPAPVSRSARVDRKIECNLIDRPDLQLQDCQPWR
jgi:hypothetical protein